MTRDDASGFEHAAITDRAAKIVADLQAKGLPMRSAWVWPDADRVTFGFRYPGPAVDWGFSVPRELLNAETVEKMLKAYL